MGKQNKERIIRPKHVDEDNKGDGSALRLCEVIPISGRKRIVSQTTFDELKAGEIFQILPSESTPKKEVSPAFVKTAPATTENGFKYNCEYVEQEKRKFCWLYGLTPVVPV